MQDGGDGTNEVHARALHRAARVLGGKTKLREYLRVSMRELEGWLAGSEKPPTDIFLKAVDIISGPTRAPAVDPEARQRFKELRETTQALLAKTLAARERAVAMRRKLLDERTPHFSVARSITAAAYLAAKYDGADGRSLVEAALDAAITATSADMGNVQLACSEGLRIVAQRGFERPFLDFFEVVNHRVAASCDVAAKSARRVVISDVAADPIFAGTPAAEVMANARARAVQSTPLIASGQVIGMLNTHFTSPRGLSEQECETLDQIARRTAFWLDGASPEA